MKLTFVVNDVATEKEDYTTIRLARRARELGHEVALTSLVDSTYEADGRVSATAHRPQGEGHTDDKAILDDIQSAEPEKIMLTDQDVILLRSDPAGELERRPWAPTSGLLFAQLCAEMGVIVLNDPRHLTDASNKTYFQTFPEAIRPRTIITRKESEIRAFIEAEGGRAVIKPLQGSGGSGVFVITENSTSNLGAMIEATIDDGYAIAQEYLPKAADGDLRLITLNGKPLKVGDQYACLRRYNDTGDARSNYTAGGKIMLEQPDKDALRAAELCAPKLIRDGMYLAGLDIVGDKMMEVNVDTPGGINLIEGLCDTDFAGAIIHDLERKVRLRAHYGGRLSNELLAVA